MASAPDDERPSQVRWLIFLLACAVSWLLYLHRYSWGIIKPYFREENPEITDVELGWLDSAFQGAYAIGQVPGGLIGDIFGPRAILAGSILFWSVAVAAVGLVAGFWAVFGIRGIFGLAQAGTYPIIGKMTRSWFPLAVRTSVQGTVAALGRIGAACCPLILATFLMDWCELPWQTALIVLAAPGIILAVVLWMMVRGRPSEHPWANEAEARLIEAGSPVPTNGDRPRVTLNRASGLSLTMLLIYAFVSTFQDQLYVYWIPTFLVDRGLSKGEMGLFTPLPLIGGAIGGILGGVLNDYFIRRTGERRWSRTGVAFTGKFVQAVFVAVALHVGDGRLAMAVLMAARIFGDWSLSTQWGAITDMGGRAAGTLFGLVNTAGAIGGFVAGPVLGWLKQEYGWEGLFWGVSAMCFVAAATWLWIDCTKRVVAD